MIYDKISNIELYRGLSEDIYDGLRYLASIDDSIENGVHKITDNVKAIVSEYETKESILMALKRIGSIWIFNIWLVGRK